MIMMRISEIEKFFDKNVSKKPLSEISWYEEKVDDILIKRVLINSQKLSFDFDIINRNIKTSDTVYFKDNKVIFVEFKSGGIKKIEFRLKAIESIISFYNYVFNNGFIENLCFPNDVFQIYFVYNRTSSPAAQFTFLEVEKSLRIEYKHLFSKLKVIDNNNFQRIFKI
jgi:hypothetical protein